MESFHIFNNNCTFYLLGQGRGPEEAGTTHKERGGLVYFDCGVYSPDEEVSCNEANGSSQQGKSQNHQHGITEVKKSWDEFRDLQLKQNSILYIGLQ